MDNEWTSKTDFKANAGRSVAWTDITDMELPVTMDILKYKRITVTALDKNSMGKDSWMGKGDFSLRKLGSIQGPPTVVSHTVRLKDKRGRAAGKVIVEALLQPLPEPAAGPATGAALQTVGVLSLLECAVSKVTETAVMGKQDLQVKLALVDWRNTTEGKHSVQTTALLVKHGRLMSMFCFSEQGCWHGVSLAVEGQQQSGSRGAASAAGRWAAGGGSGHQHERKERPG